MIRVRVDLPSPAGEKMKPLSSTLALTFLETTGTCTNVTRHFLRTDCCHPGGIRAQPQSRTYLLVLDGTEDEGVSAVGLDATAGQGHVAVGEGPAELVDLLHHPGVLVHLIYDLPLCEEEFYER
jgi:hypothetical protein